MFFKLFIELNKNNDEIKVEKTKEGLTCMKQEKNPE